MRSKQIDEFVIFIFETLTFPKYTEPRLNNVKKMGEQEEKPLSGKSSDLIHPIYIHANKSKA
jgi:hypothetical protein